MPRKKQIDIIGQRFGKMLVVREDGPGRNYDRTFICRCDCGNEKICSMSDLRKGNTKSCGCINKEKLKLMQEKNESARVDGVVPHHLTRKITHNKSTGVKGVSVVYSKKGIKLYRAYISVGGKRYCLGNFTVIDDAISVRKKAEEEFHYPILQKAQLKSMNREEQ